MEIFFELATPPCIEWSISSNRAVHVVKDWLWQEEKKGKGNVIHVISNILLRFIFAKR